MKTNRSTTFFRLLPSLLVLCSLFFTTSAHADVTKSVILDVNAGCVSTVNGVPGTTTIYEDYGSSFNLPVDNYDGVVSQTVSGTGIPSTTLDYDNKTSVHSSQTFSIGPLTTNTVTMTFTPIPSSDAGIINPNNCPIGSSPVSSTLNIVPLAKPAPAPTTAPKTTTKTTTTKPATAAATTPTPAPAATTPAPTATPQATVTKTTTKVAAVQAQPTSSKKAVYWAIPLLLIAIGGLLFARRKGMLNQSKTKPKTRSSKHR